MKKTTRRLAWVLAGGLLLAGCGDDGDGNAAKDTNTTGTTAATTSSSIPTPTTTLTGSEPPTPGEVTLASQCVRAGSKQKITVKSVDGAGFVFNSHYPDGKDGTYPDFYGGNAGGMVGPEGSWDSSWDIKENAPAGTVRITYKLAKMGFSVVNGEAFFRVVASGASCD